MHSFVPRPECSEGGVPVVIRPCSLSFQPMPEFCDVALPVPLDMAFTYRIPDGAIPAIGGRVLVPFRQQRMMGLVVALHDRKPQVTTKNILSIVDPAPLLDDHLI